MSRILDRLLAIPASIAVSVVAVIIQMALFHEPISDKPLGWYTITRELPIAVLLILVVYGGIPALILCLVTARLKLDLLYCVASGVVLITMAGALMSLLWFTGANRPPPIWLGAVFAIPGALGGATFYWIADRLQKLVGEPERVT